MFSKRGRPALDENALEREVPYSLLVVVAEHAHGGGIMAGAAVAVERIEELFRNGLYRETIIGRILSISYNLELSGIVVFQDGERYAHDTLVIIGYLCDASDIDAFTIGVRRIGAIFKSPPGYPERAAFKIFKLQVGEPADVAEDLRLTVWAQERLREGITETDFIVLKEGENILCGDGVQTADQKEFFVLGADGTEEGAEQGKWRIGADKVACFEDSLALF